MWDYLVTIAAGVAAIVAGVLPKRYWPALPALPIRKLALISAVLQLLVAVIVGIGGFIEHSARVSREMGALSIKIAEGQLSGRIAADPTLNVNPLGIALLSPLAFALFTPLGLLSTYLAFAAFARALSCIVDEPFGDPILSGIDGVVDRVFRGTRDRRRLRAREREEGPEVPDRLYTADWAGVEDADFVVVSSRRKPDWDAGTFVITPDKWYKVGTPFELRLTEGLRTIYPLKEQTAHEVLRRGVMYELPPLRPARAGAAYGSPPGKTAKKPRA